MTVQLQLSRSGFEESDKDETLWSRSSSAHVSKVPVERRVDFMVVVARRYSVALIVSVVRASGGGRGMHNKCDHRPHSCGLAAAAIGNLCTRPMRGH